MKRLVTLLAFACLIACQPTPFNDIPVDIQEFTPKALIISEQQYQTIYLDTTQSYTYFQLYAEANEMPEHQRYNGENNVWASFSTPEYWSYSDGNISDEHVYYVSSSPVRFDYPRVFNNRSTGYQPKHLDLWTKQNVGPIPLQAIKQRDTIPIYMDVSFDGEYHVKDTLFIVLQPR